MILALSFSPAFPSTTSLAKTPTLVGQMHGIPLHPAAPMPISIALSLPCLRCLPYVTIWLPFKDPFRIRLAASHSQSTLNAKRATISMGSTMIIYSSGFPLFILVQKIWWQKKIVLGLWNSAVHDTHVLCVVKPKRHTINFCHCTFIWWSRLLPDRQNTPVPFILKLNIVAVLIGIVFSLDWRTNFQLFRGCSRRIQGPCKHTQVGLGPRSFQSNNLKNLGLSQENAMQTYCHQEGRKTKMMWKTKEELIRWT